MRLSRGGRNPTSGNSSRLASMQARAIGLHEAAALGVDALGADVLVNPCPPSCGNARAAPLVVGPAARLARSNATQVITLEWTKCCGAPRISQMPSSGSRQIFSRCSRKVSRISVRARRRRQAALARLGHHIGKFAINIELQLLAPPHCRSARAGNFRSRADAAAPTRPAACRPSRCTWSGAVPARPRSPASANAARHWPPRCSRH